MRKQESLLQQNCVRLCDMFPNDVYLIAIPNEGIRSPQNANRLKSEGMRTGASDTILLFNVEKYPNRQKPIFIEFKVGKNKQSKYQLVFQKHIEQFGYDYKLIYDFETFKNILIELGLRIR